VHDGLTIPIIQAPMAGGITTPALVAAVSGAGALGFLAGAVQPATSLRAQIQEVRALTTAPFGVNLFVPGAESNAETVAAVSLYRDRLQVEAVRYGAELGDPAIDDDDWIAKLRILDEERVPVASFTFGVPPAELVARLQANGTTVVVTVTSVSEAQLAVGVGADVLCVQGMEAGGHRGRFTDDGRVDDTGLLPLLRMVSDATRLPLIAAGGLADGRDIAAVLVAGAGYAQLGTMFLATPESGAHPLHKAALVDAAYQETAVTRAFSGRPARGLVNRFMTEHSLVAPMAYPQVDLLTRPLRRAAAAAGDAQAMSLWAGQGHRRATDLPAAELVNRLWREATTALANTTTHWTPRPTT
jgi:nitronate monooxygenase